MATLGLSVANDIANAILTFYVKNDALSQTTQDKPLLRYMRKGAKEFPGGKDNVSLPVRGAFMADTAGFLAGYTQDDSLSFAQSQNVLRASYAWKELHAGLNITWTEMKQDGVTVTDDGQGTSDKPDAAAVRIVKGLVKERINDYMESYSRSFNAILWADGTQDSKAPAGLTSILTDTGATGTTGGLNRATYSWWRHRTLIGSSKITASAANTTLINTLRDEFIQLRRFGGKPAIGLCGSGFLSALRLELNAKGTFTQNGFKSSSATDVSMADIVLDNIAFEYDPSLDDKSYSRRCYVIDPKRVQLRPMVGEADKVLTPERPYNYLVFLKSMTWTGALVCDQLNANGIYEVA